MGTGAWNFTLGNDDERWQREDLAVAALFWDLTDATPDAESTQIIGRRCKNGEHIGRAERRMRAPDQRRHTGHERRSLRRARQHGISGERAPRR